MTPVVHLKCRPESPFYALECHAACPLRMRLSCRGSDLRSARVLCGVLEQHLATR